ncbi:hypothetical protein AGABI1DRAFT_86368, partial [Agaricus bisporus var. burnettii JB137-S8]
METEFKDGGDDRVDDGEEHNKEATDDVEHKGEDVTENVTNVRNDSEDFLVDTADNFEDKTESLDDKDDETTDEFGDSFEIEDFTVKNKRSDTGGDGSCDIGLGFGDNGQDLTEDVKHNRNDTVDINIFSRDGLSQALAKRSDRGGDFGKDLNDGKLAVTSFDFGFNFEDGTAPRFHFRDSVVSTNLDLSRNVNGARSTGHVDYGKGRSHGRKCERGEGNDGGKRAHFQKECGGCVRETM